MWCVAAVLVGLMLGTVCAEAEGIDVGYGVPHVTTYDDDDGTDGGGYGGHAVGYHGGTGVGYGSPPVVYPAPCYPKTIYVTKYKDVVKQVPVPNKVFKTEIVPQAQYLTHVEKVYKDVVVTNYHPKYVTTTEYLPQVQYVTDYKVDYITDYQPVYVTKNEVIPKYITQTYYESIIKNKIDYETVYKTQYLPKYETKLQVVYKTVYKTNYIPEYHTVYDTKYVVETVCPKAGYGYH